MQPQLLLTALSAALAVAAPAADPVLAADTAPAPALDTKIVKTAKNSTMAPEFAPLSNSWAMQTWSGTSCAGTHLYWSVPDGYSCTNMQSVSSLKVTNFGGCSTYYYTGNGCQGSPIHVTQTNSCSGYTQGERILSFSVSC